MRTSIPSSCGLVWASRYSTVFALGILGAGCAVESAPEPAAIDSDGDSPAAAVMPHWNALIALTGARPAVRWSEHGTPSSLFGTLTAHSSSASTADARSFLAHNAELFQLAGGAGDLAEDGRADSPLGSHVTFTQHHQGLRVYGAEVKVHFNRAGAIVAVNSGAVPNLWVDPRPAISADRALAIALAEAPEIAADADAPELPALVIHAQDGAAALAYHVIVPTGGPTLQVFVNARTGAVIGEPVDINRYVNGTGQVFRDNAVVATRNNNLVDGNDANTAVPASAYSTVTLQGLNGNNRLDGQFASGSASRRRATGTGNSFVFLRNTTAFSETMAYFHIDFAQRYIQSLGFTNVNNRQQVFSIDRLRDDNSFYTPNNQRITFGAGGVDDAEDGEVIIHEYGHAVQDNQVPGFGASAEGGAMGEGFGDYLAATVSAALAGDFQITCIAEWDATSYASGVPHCLRRLDSTKHYPEDVANEVHDDGEMWSAALFQIRTALGATKADKLVIQSHFLLSRNANFRDGSNALVTAAINLGFTTAEVSAVRTILRNRGFTVTA